MTDPVEKLDRDWDAIVARWDLEGTEDDAILAAAEAELARIGEAEPVRSASVENVIAAIEAQVRPMAPVLAMPAMRRWTKVAAAAVAGLLLTAAMTVTVVWWARRESLETLRLSDAVVILSCPTNDISEQMAAHDVAYAIVSTAAETLLQVHENTAAPDELQAVAGARRLDLLRALTGGAGIGQLPTASAKALADSVKNPALSPAVRAYCLDQLVGGGISAAQAIKNYAPTASQLLEHRELALGDFERMRRALATN